ncbi:four helix bundle protein [Flavobacterium sp.]|uniref:four helix bundle protein n=1 Tax=Flavobacterium sp. TaxID=239 RepID=UPI002B4AC3D1|nr:four helix bundle protein [Flavobacterium sp.]HLP65848.1 four helix bundle protein [Flavobacterium sp.]
MRFQDLLAYKKSFILSMEIFEVSKKFPSEEKYSLTDQIRRSSRSVSANIADASRKIRYQKHFISKLSDSDSENAETQSWLEYALACNYLTNEVFNELTNKSLEVGKLINFMINNPDKFS